MLKRLGVEKTRVDSIVVQPRLRTPTAAAINLLAESMREMGLIEPIVVRIVEEMEIDGQAWSNVPVLVYGATRLAAAKQLGWAQIDTDIVKGDEIDIKLWEIAENLHRGELTDAERRVHIAEWVRLTAQKVSHGGTPTAGGLQSTEKAIRKAANELGLGKSTVQRAVAAESLADEVKAQADAAGIGTVKRAEIARLGTSEAQLAAIRKAREVKSDAEIIQDHVAALMAAWYRAPTEAREIFLEKIDTPVFDRAAG